MYQAEIHLHQEKPCVLSSFADEFDAAFDIAIEELHNERVTFVLEIDDPPEGVYEHFAASEQVHHVERLDEGSYLVTKTSCGAYSAIDRNHGILRRRNEIGRHHRVYTVLFFRREDLRSMVADFRRIGSVTLGKLKRFDEPSSTLTERQREVVEHAFDRGYFEWPRRANCDELAEDLGVSRATFLEHLRKAEAKLLAEALEDRPSRAERYADPVRGT
ncbi:helix-turn-helix domain-containing protein [Halomarina litorea]|uniref:helix-turn-helix domain-containing protein n=1 Tax=Halomarina litorea TaxID=2961595 RepID=UPI0020C362FE|nr:helix-turn-helix domain-containing protein [Halomarina sp. BCD28]